MLGLIGLGLVGTALCERFVRAGWTVCGFDVEAMDIACLNVVTRIMGLHA